MHKEFIPWTTENIINLRVKMGLTQFGLSQEVHINCQNIKFWELPESNKEHRKPGLVSMTKMGKFYGVFFYADWTIPKEGTRL